MSKIIETKLKQLFEFQKFEENPILKQTVKDSIKDSSFRISDLELSEILGGSKADYEIKDCPVCGNKDSLIVYKTSNNTYEYCMKCYHSK